MRVHHLDCARMREIEPADGPDSPLKPAHGVSHVLVVETDSSGLVLVDAGIGTGDIADPSGRLMDDWVEMTRPALDPATTAAAQIEALGLSPSDVRHIVVTHLHRDHAGGLSDFPDAAVHLFEAERADGGKTPALRGIYATRVHGVADAPWPSVSSFGTRPTVDGIDPLLEAHLFDFDGDLYGQRIEVEFVARLRDEEKFPDLPSLVAQMQRDDEQARSILSSQAPRRATA